MNGSDSATDRGEQRTNDAEPTDGSVAGAAAAALSRRRFLRASAAATAAGVGLGASGSAAAQAQETCEANTELEVEGEWNLLVNPWGNPDATECVWINEDGSFGYNFDASGLDPESINYPEVYCGRRPWGNDSGASEFPLRRGDVDELILEVDADLNISGGEWDWAEEWWLLDGEPSAENPPYTHEIMLVMDWGGGHSHYMEERNVFSDQFGNQFDYWANYSSGGTDADFHIFRVNGGLNGSGKVDLKEIVDFMSRRHGVREDLTISGIEVGNEYWGGASGEVTYNNIELQVNGNTHAAGSSTGGGEDTTAPSMPSNVSVTDTSESSVTVSWNSASDSGGSGLAEYVVSAGGSETTVSAGTTEATVDGLQSDTQYEVSVVAVDGAGNESDAGTTTARTDDDGGTTPQATVSVDLSSTEIGTGGQSTASVVLDEAPGGISGFDLTVSVDDPSVATIESAAVGGDMSSIGGEPSPSGGGSSATISGADLSESVYEGATDVELATVTLAGQSSGEADVSVEVSNLDANDGGEVSVSTQGATLTVGTAGPGEVDGTTPTDPDGDGLYEDLNGNGEVDYDDVVEYFNNMENPEVTDNVQYYDYNGNDDIDFADVVELFKQVE